MFCPKCGEPIADGAKFCEKCGAPMEAAEENTATWGTETNENTFYAQPAAPVVAKFSGKAIAAFVLSLVGILYAGIICGTLGIVFSALALNDFRKDIPLKGKGLAIAGLVISIIDVVIVALYLLIG